MAACAGVVLAPGSTENAVANGDTRTIHLYHAHTHESIDATYLVNGQYDSGVLEKLNWFLRDWRRDEPTHMDPRLFDVVWEVYRESGSSQPIEVMSAYRSPETNAMLRRRSRAVAEHSQHILGKAMDQHYMDVPTSRIREIAMRLQRGGVGFYPTAGSPFVHMDVGGVRHWPRMSYDQLARLFPDGKTVHIPSNGVPLARYEEARAELEARGDNFNYPTASEVKSKGFFAWLFGGGEDEDEGGGGGGSTRSDGRKGAAGTRYAAVDRAPGPVVADNGFSTSKDAGARAFILSQATPAPAPSSAQVFGRRTPPPAQAVQMAALEEKQRAADALAQQKAEAQQRADVQARGEAQVRAQQALAEAMAAQEQARKDKAAAEAAAAATAVAAAAEEKAAPLAAAEAVPPAPLPPRRPIELASPGPVAPLPPPRPVELAKLGLPGPTSPMPPTPPARPQAFASLTLPPTAPTADGARRDPISALIATGNGRTSPSLPAAITQGMAPAKPPGLAKVLAYAAPAASEPGTTGSTTAPTRAAVPLPVARPSQFVAARLDRSNFRTLTGTTTAVRTPARSAFGSAVGALRPAAQANLAVLSADPSAGVVASFGSRASDLSVDHFSGPATTPLERIATPRPTVSD